MKLPRWEYGLGDEWLLVLDGMVLIRSNGREEEEVRATGQGERESTHTHTHTKNSRFTHGVCVDCGLSKVVFTESSLCPSCSMIRGSPP